MGDLWWYTILLFVAQRFGDVINLFVGLWLVPKYVPQQDLGAVLPLTQAVALVGLPLSVLAIPFMKFLNVYAEKGEIGKVKSLLRDVFVGTGVLALVTLLIAWLVLPFFFTRTRVVSGSLGFLIVLGSILGAVSCIFSNAVQGLKLYDVTVWFTVLGAPFRLLTMLVTMPFRALSGYFAGQCAGPATSVFGAVWALRKKLGPAVKAEPYWREDGAAMIHYTMPIALWTAVTTVIVAIETLIIRHRLPDFESAGYYMITRFTDIASYFGSAFIVFLFPMVAGKKTHDADSRKILLHSVFGTVGGGLAVGVVLAVFGKWILSLQDIWATYGSMSGMMLPVCVLNVLIMACNCFCNYEFAQGRFGFLWYGLPLLIGRCVFLYAVTGMGFFRGVLPDSLIAFVESWNPCSLTFLIGTMTVVQAVLLVFFFCDVFCSRRQS